MQFELTEALIDDILFSMEDQNGEFYVDSQDGMVAGGQDFEFQETLAEDEEEAPDRYIALPEWDSAEGFRLMERFAAGFRNPPIRDKLTAALDRGKGVFRAFKDVLSAHPEAEQLWFAFKEQEMRRVITNWYNALREEWGLERIGTEPEETEDLVLEDFRFRDGVEADRVIAQALHIRCMDEQLAAAEIPPTEPGLVLAAETGGWTFPGDLALVAETGNGDFAGYASARRDGRALRITALEVRPEYRGLGVGEALLTRLLKKIDPRDVSDVLIDLPAGVEGFSRVLVRESFNPQSTRYWLQVTPREPGP
ncbi:MAG: GNAT family N-acetyltransferase [Spirochaetaceae bacterium]|jgi:ribosomal protein S18 acetylase RimI-like enzyme|nr:GNAT family N-acetyltransferase [Spirochaetaceae bacterium]